MNKNSKTAKQLLILFLVKAGLTKLNPSSKVVRGRRVISMLTGNPNYVTPSPTLADLTNKTDALENAEAAMDGSKIKTQQRDIALNNFMAIMTQMQAYVQNVANGDVEKILSSGFEVRNPRTKPVKLAAPDKLSIVPLSNAVTIKWKANAKSKLNVVQMSTTGLDKDWELRGESTKSTITIGELTPGTSYYFRIAHVNAAGIGDWSETVVCIPNF